MENSPLVSDNGLMMKKEIIVRPMQEADLNEVHAIELLAHPDPWKYELLRGEFQNTKYHHHFVAEHTVKNKIVGYCFCWGWKGVDLTLSNIAVHIDTRRRGIGALLMEKAINTAKQNQCISVILEVRESNRPAIAMYERFGFEVVGRRKNYYTSPQEDGLIMRLPVAGNKQI